MKTIKTVLILCLALCFASSCKKEVDMALVQKTVLENTDIRQFKVSDAWQITIVYDSLKSFVELNYSAYLDPYIKTKIEGTKLELGFTENVHPVINSIYRATIHTNKVERIEAEDAAQLKFIGHFSATNDTLYVELDDASICSGLDYSGHVCEILIEDASQFLDFQLSGYNCEVKVSNVSACKGKFDMTFHLVADLNWASQFITFGGAAPYGMIKLQGSSMLNMAQTKVNEMYVDLTGTSEATVNVIQKLSGSLMETSTLYYKGHPQIDIECSEGSELIPL